MMILPLVTLLLSLVACGEEKSLEVTVSAYNSTPTQTDALHDLAAWGDRLEPGMKVVAVSRDLVEQGLGRGTKIRIEGLDGEFIVLDRTHSRLRRRVDVYMGLDVDAAREFGIRKTRIFWRDGDVGEP